MITIGFERILASNFIWRPNTYQTRTWLSSIAALISANCTQDSSESARIRWARSESAKNRPQTSYKDSPDFIKGLPFKPPTTGTSILPGLSTPVLFDVRGPKNRSPRGVGVNPVRSVHSPRLFSSYRLIYYGQTLVEYRPALSEAIYIWPWPLYIYKHGVLNYINIRTDF